MSIQNTELRLFQNLVGVMSSEVLHFHPSITYGYPHQRRHFSCEWIANKHVSSFVLYHWMLSFTNFSIHNCFACFSKYFLSLLKSLIMPEMIMHWVLFNKFLLWLPWDALSLNQILCQELFNKTSFIRQTRYWITDYSPESMRYWCELKLSSRSVTSGLCSQSSVRHISLGFLHWK